MAETADEESLESAFEDRATAEWTVDRAEELGLDPQEFLERIVRAYRAADGSRSETDTPEPSFEELSASIEELEAEFGELLEDVRERVIQVKQETDAKAPLEHDHEDLASQIQTVSSDIERMEDEVAGLEERLTGGFENFEEIIEFLLDRTDALRTDLQTLGGAMVSMQNRVEQLSAREQARARADHLKQDATAHGVKTAVCESCRETVNLAMLSEATCPTCEAVFRELEPNPGFFGTSTLRTGRRPALEGPSEVPDTDALASMVAGEDVSPDAERPEWRAPTEPDTDQEVCGYSETESGEPCSRTTGLREDGRCYQHTEVEDAATEADS